MAHSYEPGHSINARMHVVYVEVPVTFISSHPQTMTYLIGMWINLIA